MKLASHLWKSRHGIYYIRVSHGGLEIKRSLKTRDPLIAKNIAYTLGNHMTIPKDILDKLLSGRANTKVYTIKTGDMEIHTDGSPEDHANLMEALALVLQLKNSQPHSNTKTNELSTKEWSLQKCIDDYRAERDSSVKPKTRQFWNTAFKKLIEGFGGNLSIKNIDPDAYATWRAKTIYSLVPSSQDSKNNTYKIFFDWCLEHDRCNCNPVVSLKLNKNKRAELQLKGGKPRIPYESKDFIKIFNPEMRELIRKPCMYWLPLMAFYTGARLEELGAIEINDINEYKSGKWQLKLKKGKNIQSVRTIPIHPEIIKSGFIEYINDVRQVYGNEDAITLFPYMKPVSDRLTHRFSQDYGLFRTKLGITKGKDFHSFRTTLIGCLKRNRAGEEVKRAYVGHENEGKKDEHNESYSDKTPFLIDDLADEIIPKINYELSHGFVMPAHPIYTKGRFVPYLRSTIRKAKKSSAG